MDRVLLRSGGEDVVRVNVTAARAERLVFLMSAAGKVVMINELAVAVVKLCGKNLGVAHVEPREGDMRHSRASMERARSIGYEPEHSLEEGVKETMVV